MRILTVKQPWAWAIIHAGKDVENRRRSLGDYTGPVAIHVSRTDDDSAAEVEHPLRGLLFPTCPNARYATHNMHWCTWCSKVVPRRWSDQGHIIGVVDLYETHEPLCETDEYPSCSPWAEADSMHLVLGKPRALANPIPFKGALGLRRLDAATIDLIQKELA